MELTYHIYLKKECLFKDLSQSELDIIWGRIYRSYFTEDLTYTVVSESVENYADASF